MWVKQFSKVYKDIQKEAIWHAWADVNHWARWDSELEYCDLKGEFIQGEQFILKPRGGPKVKITLSTVITHEKFTDYCQFFGATMYDAHELTNEPDGLRITNTITITGPLAFLWLHLVAKKVARAVPIQTDNLVAFVRSNHG